MEGPLSAPHTPAVGQLPLRGLRVVETYDETSGDDSAGLAGRLLADLGADVVLVEPPGGSRARLEAPLVDGESLPFAVRNANKRSAVVDLTSASGQEQLIGLLGRADVWLDSAAPRIRAGTPLDPATVHRELAGLVIVSITPFGSTGPYRDHAATHSVLFALSGLLALSRLPGRPPLLPPGRMAYAIGGAMAAYLALVAVWRRLEGGAGDLVEVSLHAAMVQAADAILPVADMVTRAGTRTYPVYRCRDGVVRLVLLTPRHIASMSSWLAESGTVPPGELAELDAKYRSFFADRSTAEVVEEAQRRGIPLSPIMPPTDLLAMRGLRAAGALVHAEVLPGRRAWIPSGYFEVDHQRAGFRQCAPGLGEHTGTEFPTNRGHPVTSDASAGAVTGRPLRGLLVLDFGLVYAGPEVGKLLADHGADVIKVETRTSPDLTRLAGGDRGMTAQFVTLNRNKRSLGVDLRTARGLELVGRLVKMADVLVENMAPGAMAKLGLGPDALLELNATLVVVRSQLFSPGEARSHWRGFGPSARGLGGLTALWRYADDDTGFAETASVFPDYLVGRLGAVAALAALIARRSSGRGQSITVPQVDAVMNYLSDVFAADSLEPPSVDESAASGPWGVYRCAGDDEWCVVTVRDDADADRLRSVLGDRPLEAIEDWTAMLPPGEVMDVLQRAGVPAAAVLRPLDVVGDPQLAADGFVRVLDQPGFDALLVEGDCFHADGLSPTPLEPAPQHGQHTREIATDLLGLSDDEVDRLVAAGVLEVPPP